MPRPTPRSTSVQPRFRRDLRIRRHPSATTDDPVEIEDPIDGALYAFDAQTLALFRAFDGRRDCAAIAADFNARFGTQLSLDEVERFRDEALANGLIELVAEPELTNGDQPQTTLTTRTVKTGRASDDGLDDDRPTRDEAWTLFDPAPLLGSLARTLTTLRPVFLLLVVSLIGLVPLALYTLFDNQSFMQQDLARLDASSSYLGRLLFSLLLINLLRCLVQGVMIAHYGGQSRAFGIRLRFGILPRFFIDKSAIRDFQRSAQLWTWGSNLLFRLVLAVIGAVGWYSLRSSGSSLAINLLVLAHAALIGFLLVCLPLRASDGYRWLMTWRRLPLTTLKLALIVLGARLRGRPLPTSITPKQAWRLLLYALALILFWTWAFVRIVTHIAGGLIESFPQLFGEATEALILLAVALLVVRWGWRRLERFRGDGRASARTDFDALPESRPEEHANRLAAQAPRLVGFGLLALLLALPFPYRPGGLASLLPPEQQEIQAPVSGRIIQVLQRGGDGTLIEAGETVAIMLADELEQQILSLREQIREQEAVLAQRQAQLAQLLAGPRPESIAEARARAERAREEVRMAEQQLDTARATSLYSDRELDRMKSLPKGLISELEIARSEKQSTVDRLRIIEQETVVKARLKSLAENEAQLALLLNGATVEEIEIARQSVAEAEATIRRLRQTFDHARNQLNGTQLRMPFTGYLVDAYLQQKVGMHLTQGSLFATAQVKRRPLVEMVLPESEVAEIAIDSTAEIRLMAHASRPFEGRVVVIEPTGTESTFGQTFKVLIELIDTDAVLLKPGMSGYGKIMSGDKPLYVQLGRPLARFAAIEIWSWLP